ncbi:hypothetical protein Tco_1115259, partial [Tanacetum coccineum]
MEWVTKQARLILPYGTLFTRLFKFVMSESSKLSNESYVLYDRVMNPLTAYQERKTRKDRSTRRGRHSTSSSSAFDQPSSSYLNDDDDGNGKGTSRAITPSPVCFVNSLTNDVPQFVVSTAQRLQRKYAKCLLLLVHNCSAEVNVASENMFEVTTASEYQVNAANMDQDSAHMVDASKVPMLKPSEYEIWRMRIEQYIQMIDYALWEVIENGATLPKTTTLEAIVTVMPITTAKEKAQRRLEVKARITL